MFADFERVAFPNVALKRLRNTTSDMSSDMSCTTDSWMQNWIRHQRSLHREPHSHTHPEARFSHVLLFCKGMDAIARCVGMALVQMHR